jgi:hypothetical protein
VTDGQASSTFVPHSPQALGSNARICAAIRGECSFPVPLPPPTTSSLTFSHAMRQRENLRVLRAFAANLCTAAPEKNVAGILCRRFFSRPLDYRNLVRIFLTRCFLVAREPTVRIFGWIGRGSERKLTVLICMAILAADVRIRGEGRAASGRVRIVSSQVRTESQILNARSKRSPSAMRGMQMALGIRSMVARRCS